MTSRDFAPAQVRTVPGRTVRWGVAGPGRIAARLVADFGRVDGARLVAVASRSAQRAADFAEQHGLVRAHGSYAALVDDPDIDAVYIATPHAQHHAIAVAALRNGKAVLVEKAFTATTAGAQEVAAVAREEGRFAMEAMWTRFHPAAAQVRDWVAGGSIGEVRAVQADLGVIREYDTHPRVFDRTLGGGALLEVGVYVASFADMILGEPARVVAHGRIGPTGVDDDVALLLTYAGGATAVLTGSLRGFTPGQARVFGSEGWIDVLPPFHHPARVVLHRFDADPISLNLPAVGDGYAGEIAEVTNGVRAGLVESTIMPLDSTICVQRVLEDAGHQLGVAWSEDRSVL